MRPIKLEMNAFGPYKDLTIIDFDKMGERGLFLLTGDTGSGKTMIFDALTFALFGQSSGNDRHITSFRSHHASPYEETYVSLLFSHKNKEYKIKRIPTQSYIKRKGKEATQTLHQVELTLPNGEHITSVMGGNEKIQEILGLDYQQFTQVALLGQGEFRKLLNTNSTERSKIFRKIFNTSFYDRFQDRLSRLNSASKKEYDLVITKIKTIFEEHEIEDIKIELLDEELDRLEKTLESNQKILSDLEKEYNKLQKKRILENKILDQQNTLIEEFKSLEAIKENLKELESQKNKIEKLENKLEQLNNALIHIKPLFVSLKTLEEKVMNDKNRLNELKTQKKENDEALTEALNTEFKLNQEKPEIEKHKTQIHTLSESIPKYEILNSLQLEINSNVNSLKEKSEKLQTTKDSIESLELKMKRLNKDLKTKNKIEKDLILIKEDYDKLSELIKMDDLIKDLEKDLMNKNDKLQIAQKKVNDKRTQLNHAEHIFYSSQAGYLAQKLKEDEPCPVCGSTHHPQKATISDETVSKALLDDLNNIIDKLQKSRDKVNDEVVLIKGRLSENKVQFKKKQNDIKDIHQSFKEVSIQKKSLEESFETLKDSDLALKSNETRLETLKENEITLTKKVNTLNLKHKEVKTRFEELNKTLKYDSLNKAKSVLDSLNHKVDDFTKSLEENESSIKKLNTTKDTLNAHIKAITDTLVNGEQVIKTDTKRFKLVLSEHEFKDKDSFKQLLKLEENKKELQDKVLQFNNLLIKQNTKKESLVTKLKDKAYPNTQLQNQKLKDLETTIQEHSKNMRSMSSQVEKIDASLKRLKSYEKDLIKKREAYQEINMLFKTANAQLSGKDRITFEFYVQTAYFTKVIHEANKRLGIMTGGRYALKLRAEATDKRNVTGLDLDVIDFHTNKTREVSTLSGGESFKAALSLALGMSDVIQIFAGGIEIDMLFVDEGFGSLDQESLDQAIEVLNDLSSDHRLIGIISHVSELKGRIDKQIVVHKDITGSHVEMIV